jgi:hypothetical protein
MKKCRSGQTACPRLLLMGIAAVTDAKLSSNYAVPTVASHQVITFNNFWLGGGDIDHLHLHAVPSVLPIDTLPSEFAFDVFG